MSDTVNDVFVKYNYKLKGLVVGGPGPTKENFVKAKELNYQIKVVGIYDTGYTDEHMGIGELLEKCKEALSEESAIREKKIMERFLTETAHSGLAASGYANVKKALMSKNITMLIVSEDAEMKRVSYHCTLCNSDLEFVEEGNSVHEKHESDGGKLQAVKQEDAIEELLDMADKNGTEISFIGGESNYGRELLLGFHGIAALLKYRT